MNSNSPLLTIGIPTWNRKDELRACLDLVLPQAAAEQGVEVMVCDNASKDDTQSFMNGLVPLYPNLRYERNQTNIGSERNFIEVLRRGAGTYVWILSDDDFLAEGAVRAVLQIIRTHQPSYICMNYAYCDSRRRITALQPDRRYMVKQDVAHADLNRTLLIRNHWLGFLSCSIYRRELLDFDDLFANREKVPHWIQAYMTAQVLARGKDGYHSSFLAVYCRMGNDRTDSTSFIAYMPDAYAFIARRFHVDRTTEAAVNKGIRETFLSFPNFLAYRARGLWPSPLILPFHYRIVGGLFPRFLLVWLRGAYRLFRSRSTLPNEG